MTLDRAETFLTILSTCKPEDSRRLIAVSRTKNLRCVLSKSPEGEYSNLPLSNSGSVTEKCLTLGTLAIRQPSGESSGVSFSTTAQGSRKCSKTSKHRITSNEPGRNGKCEACISPIKTESSFCSAS